MPGTRPGVVQQGGEDDERLGIIAFETPNRARFLTIQEKLTVIMRKAAMCFAHSFVVAVDLRPEEREGDVLSFQRFRAFCGGV